MADPVEIQNVGGLRGVASEVTLLELRDAMREFNRSGSSNNSSNTSARLQDLYNRSVRESTKSNWVASKVNAALDTKTGRLITSFAKGATTLSDFSSAVFGTESSLTKLANYIDSNISTWRELSSVGASFNNSLFDMISSAANSGMELDDYSKMIMRNSEQLARFGGTVTNGAKFVGEFSKTFRRDLGSRFFEMGFTIEDINESLIGFMSLESRRSANGLRDDRKTQASAANYILQLDKLAKLTGEERKQLADRISQQQTDAGIAARINSLQGAQQENLQSAIAFFDSQLPGVSDGFKDLMDGVAQTDLGKALETAIPGIGQYMQQVFTGEEDINEVLSALQDRFGPALSNFSSGFNKAQIDQMRMQGGVTGALAELMDSLYQFNQVSQLSAEEMAEEQNRRNAVTSAFGKFEQAVIDLRRMFVDFFYDFSMEKGGLFDAFFGLGEVVGELFGSGTKSLKGAGISITGWLKDLMGGLFGRNGWVTWAIKTFTDWLKSDDFKVYVNNLKESFTAVSTWMSDLVKDISEQGFWNTFKEQLSGLGTWIKELFLGSTVTEMTPAGPQEVRKESLLEKIQEFIFGDELSRPGDSLYDRFVDWVGLDSRSDKSVFDQIIDWVGLNSRSDESLLSQVYNKVLDAFLGKEVMVGREDDRQLVRQGGLFESMADAFANFWEGPTGTNLANTISNFFKELVDNLILSINESTGGLFFGGAAANILSEQQAAGAILTPEQDAIVKEQRFEDRASLIDEAAVGLADSLLSSYDLFGNTLYSMLGVSDTLKTDTAGWFRKWSRSDQGLAAMGFGDGGDQSPQSEGFRAEHMEGFSNGTNGFRNFGSGTMAMLHNSEAVVPRNTPAGDLLQSFYDFQNKKVSPITSTPATSDSQSSLIKKVEELNTTMIKVAELLQSSVGLQEKTVKGVKGLGSDFYRGIGR